MTQTTARRGTATGRPQKMSDVSKTLTPGTLYRIKWPHHYNKVQVDPGYLGRFLNWRPRFDSLHGDLMHQEALFQRVKSSGRDANYMFGVSPTEAEITEDIADGK